MIRRLVWCVPLVAALTGCASFSRLDRQVESVVTAKARRASRLTTNALADAFQTIQPAPSGDILIDLDLTNVLRTAARFSRDLQERRETLYLQGISLLSTRRSFGLGVDSTLSYVLSLPEDDDESYTTQLDAEADRILPSGATVSFSGTTSMDTESTTNAASQTQYSSSLSLRLTQPLLAGAGYTASHEDLVQAERDLLYSLRSFALERQDLAIGTVEDYYNLLIQQAVLANTRLNVEQSTLLRKRSEALFRVRRGTALDVMRSQQQELSAKNQLSKTEAAFDIAVRRFVLALGLPVASQVRLLGAIPERRSLPFDEAVCIGLALARRLDLKTAMDKYGDAKRQLRAQRSLLLPDLEAYGKASLSSEESSSLGGSDFQNEISAGLTLEIPLDKRDERDAVRKAEITVDAAARDLAEKQDSVRLEIIESFRNLRFLSGTVDIERQNMVIAEKRARNARLRFKNGELENRDVVEAENELLDARNAYVRALANYEVQRLRLIRNAGSIDVVPDGSLIELPVRPSQAADTTGAAAY